MYLLEGRGIQTEMVAERALSGVEKEKMKASSANILSDLQASAVNKEKTKIRAVLQN